MTTNNKPDSSEYLEKILIGLYGSAMLHGEAQANGVLPTQEQREQTIILAKAQISEYYTNKYLEALPPMPRKPFMEGSYTEGRRDALWEVRQAIKQLSKE